MIAMPTKPLLWFAGGHTGGHLYPGLALAEQLRQLHFDSQFLRQGHPLEKRILEQESQRQPDIQHRQIAGLGQRKPQHLWQSYRSLGRLAAEQTPAACIALGGAAGLAPAFWCRRRGIPIFALEQNRILGRANRWLARIATRVISSFDDLQGPRYAMAKCLKLGCPVRAEFSPSALPRNGRLLIIGGSQGAADVNQTVLAALQLDPQLFQAFSHLTHICGAGKAGELEVAYRTQEIQAQVLEYADDSATLMREASLVIARAGGSTVAELAAIGRPAIFLPYPHHKDRQQFLNAEALTQVGAAWIVEPKAKDLRDCMQNLQTDGELDYKQLDRCAIQARQIPSSGAAQRIAETIAAHLGENLAVPREQNKTNPLERKSC